MGSSPSGTPGSGPSRRDALTGVKPWTDNLAAHPTQRGGILGPPIPGAPMLPVGPLMVEHRLIERMIALMARESRRIQASGKADLDLVLGAIDFVRTYADRCHHGKEEDILFRALREKPLSLEHQERLEELEREHGLGREGVARLEAARAAALRGERGALPQLAAALERITTFYPRHIAKEDRDFFLPCMDYFSGEEQTRMLEAFADFDRALVHTLYAGRVEQLEMRVQAARRPGSLEAAGPAGERFVCSVCGYTYDQRYGDPASGVAPGTPFAALPEGWICPHCHASRSVFIRRSDGSGGGAG